MDLQQQQSVSGRDPTPPAQMLDEALDGIGRFDQPSVLIDIDATQTITRVAPLGDFDRQTEWSIMIEKGTNMQDLRR